MRGLAVRCAFEPAIQDGARKKSTVRPDGHAGQWLLLLAVDWDFRPMIDIRGPRLPALKPTVVTTGSRDLIGRSADSVPQSLVSLPMELVGVGVAEAKVALRQQHGSDPQTRVDPTRWFRLGRPNSLRRPLLRVGPGRC